MKVLEEIDKSRKNITMRNWILRNSLGFFHRRRWPIPSWLGWSEYHPKAPYPPVYAP